MPNAQVIGELATQVRSHTLGILTAAVPSALTWTPPGTANHMLWHAGHALWVQDLLCVILITGSSEIPADWADMFAQGSQPETITSWPEREQVQTLLEKQLARILELLADTTDEFLQQTSPDLSDDRTNLGWIVHGFHDEAKHCGEMALLSKQFRAIDYPNAIPRS